MRTRLAIIIGKHLLYGGKKRKIKIIEIAWYFAEEKYGNLSLTWRNLRMKFCIHVVQQFPHIKCLQRLHKSYHFLKFQKKNHLILFPFKLICISRRYVPPKHGPNATDHTNGWIGKLILSLSPIAITILIIIAVTGIESIMLDSNPDSCIKFQNQCISWKIDWLSFHRYSNDLPTSG